MHQHVAETAREVGLTYNFDDVVVANSFNAQRLIQLAKRSGLGDAAEERLFRAYFTEGENIDDHETLARLGSELGLDAGAVKKMLAGSDFTEEVEKDEEEAREIGVTGVPFFVINHTYAVSGAQAPETFLKGLELAWKEYEQTTSQVTLTADGETCSAEGNC
jgi:predicted DsbA family dithiol-disulfide isomerase